MKVMNCFFYCFVVITTSGIFALGKYPKRFDNIEKKNLIKPLQKNELSFSDYPKVYNPSYVEFQGKKLLFTRIEGETNREIGTVRFYDSYIGISEKKDNNEWAAIQKIQLPTKYAEDPRVISCNGKILLFYNDLIDENSPYRVMKIAALDEKYRVEKIVTVNPQINLYEKNWAPFTINSDPNNFYFVYSYSPFVVYKCSFIDADFFIKKMKMPNSSFYANLGVWENVWEKIRGGTPLVQINDSTLFGLFHSSFHCVKERKRWYVIGAIIVKMKDGNFYIDRISNSPLIYKMMYSTKFGRTSDRKKRVLFPGGLSISGQMARIYLGVNDAFIQEIDFRLTDLMKGMTPIH